MKEFFYSILFEPLFNAFVALYNIFPDVGIVILILTVVIKLILYPLTGKSIKAQKSLQDLQPKLEELKKKHKDNQQVLAQETMKLYKEHKVNPFGSCLPILVQLPIFLALYWVLRDALTAPDFSVLYSFVSSPETINPMSFGLVNLGEMSIPLALGAGLAQFWQAKTLSRKKPPKKAGEDAKDEDMMAKMNKNMLMFMPILTVVIGLQLPGGLALYWLLSTAITAFQQQVLFRKKDEDKKDDSSIMEGKLK